jgi:hypothetical protein
MVEVVQKRGDLVTLVGYKDDGVIYNISPNDLCEIIVDAHKEQILPELLYQSDTNPHGLREIEVTE